jgi:hypothetical protein
MSSSKPKPLTFTQWLMATGTISGDELTDLHRDFYKLQQSLNPLSTYDTSPRTFTQFVAKKYPREFIVYQSMRRLTQ